jgi:hypothetical protein
LPSADSLVSASSQPGISGSVDLIGPRVDLNGSLVVLWSELRNAAAVSRTSCDTGGRKQSSLVDAGPGGLPQDTETTIPALHIANRAFGPDAGRHAAPTSSTTNGDRLPQVPQTARLTMSCG